MIAQQKTVTNQMNDFTIITKITNALGDQPPWHRSQISWSLKQLMKNDNEFKNINYSDIEQKILYFNQKSLQLQLCTMMEKIIRQMLPQLPNYQKNDQSIKSIIYQHVDMEKFPFVQKISKIENNGQNTKNSEKKNITDEFNTQLIAIMQQLFRKKKQFLGYSQNLQISSQFLQLLLNTIGITSQLSLHQNKQPPQPGSFIKRKSLQPYRIKILNELSSMDLKQLLASMRNNEKQQLITLLEDFLNRQSQNKSFSYQFQQIKKQIQSLITLLNKYQNIQDKIKYQQYKQIKWIVLVYKILQQHYEIDTSRRKFIMKFCTNTKIQTKQLPNPYAVVKVLQNINLKQNPILKSLHSLSIIPTSKKQKQSQQQQTFISTIKHQLNYIHLFQSKKKYDKQPVINFQRLTPHRQKLISFLFSGFLSEDTCKNQEWEGIINNSYDSQIYAIRWEGKSIDDLLKYTAKSILDIGTATFARNRYLIATTIINNIYQKIKQNPFTSASATTIPTGQYMAQFLIRNFEGHFINLIGFSLGTTVIYHILKKLAQKNYLHIINKIYLLGGAADLIEFEILLKQIQNPLTIINFYTTTDNILKYFLKLCQRSITPIGLNPFNQQSHHQIQNYDLTTTQINGHLSYRRNLALISKKVQMYDD